MISDMEKKSTKNSLEVNKLGKQTHYYKDFSFYNVVEAAYSIDKNARLSKIEKNSDSSFTLTISFNTKDIKVEQVVNKLKKIKYFYKIDEIVQDREGNVGITFVFNNQHKIENTV